MCIFKDCLLSVTTKPQKRWKCFFFFSPIPQTPLETRYIAIQNEHAKRTGPKIRFIRLLIIQLCATTERRLFLGKKQGDQQNSSSKCPSRRAPWTQKLFKVLFGWKTSDKTRETPRHSDLIKVEKPLL